MRGRPSTGQVREIRIPDDLWNLVQAEAAADGVSAAQWVRDAITIVLDDGLLPFERLQAIRWPPPLAPHGAPDTSANHG